MIGNTPEFENSTSDKCFDRLLDAGLFDIVWIGSGVRGRMIVFETWNGDVITAMWMTVPAEIHTVSVRIVKFVVRSSRPLNINSGGVSTTAAVTEWDFQNRRVEIAV
ncbi:hypothetical protein GJ630_11500 [Haloarcula sp. CBA1122]|nr:hypothetical protein [Haloarcula sp. CBA1122]MUV50266.1 hypothetical protein [Haloarcula sp. CBA1122]